MKKDEIVDCSTIFIEAIWALTDANKLCTGRHNIQSKNIEDEGPLVQWE